jgi:hypothetical protein
MDVLKINDDDDDDDGEVCHGADVRTELSLKSRIQST